MGEEGGGKLTGIRQIVRLRKMLQRWQSIARGPREDQAAGRASGGIPPAVDKRLKGAQVQCDSDEDGCMSPEPPSDVPKGYIPVYVGPEQRRFVIPTSYLSLPVFKVLLEKAEEEFGFDRKGALTFPCQIETFKYILQCMERHRKGLIDDGSKLSGLVEVLVKRLRDGSPMTPRGYVPVYVGLQGEESKRFMIQTASLGDADMCELLCRSAEEYGFCNRGVLKIPCDAKSFQEQQMTKGTRSRRVMTA